MISEFIFYLNNWGCSNIIHRMHGPNLYPSNVGEVIIMNYMARPTHFTVTERIVDYDNHTIHYKVELCVEVGGLLGV